jgi:hypothetical protein
MLISFKTDNLFGSFGLLMVFHRVDSVGDSKGDYRKEYIKEIYF